MNIVSLTKKDMTLVYIKISKGDAYKHIPRTSTIASSATGFPSVRSLECSDEALSKRLSTLSSDSFPTHLHSNTLGITHHISFARLLKVQPSLTSPSLARRRLSRHLAFQSASEVQKRSETSRVKGKDK